jgi:hypothetical protein
MNPTDATAQAHTDAAPTELAAARRAGVLAGKLRPRVLQLVVDAGDAGLTATEAYELYVGLYGEPRGGLYSISPRLSELERSGWVVKGQYIRERRNSYVATAQGRGWADGRAAA